MALIDKVKGTPVDRTAGLVTSQRKQEFDDTAHIVPSRWHSETPPPLRKRTADMRSGTDLTGQKFGWLIVVGMADHKALGQTGPQRAKRGALWAVRCVCGKYEIRRRRGLTNEKNKEDRCEACWKLARMKCHRDYLDGKPQRALWEY